MSDSYNNNNNQDSQDTGAYDQMSGQDGDMGGGRGAVGSGVAGGYEGNQNQSQDQSQGQSQNANQSQSGTGTGQTAEKQDWLDKSLETAGKKFGVNISDANADKIGDFVNKEFQSKAGRGIPGVQ